MSSSRGQGFSQEELESLGLWDAGENFGYDAKKQPESAESTVLTVEAIEKMQQQAYDEAFAQGKQEGYEKGYQEGQSRGYEAGFVEGKQEGEKKGYDDNLDLLRKQSAEFVSLLESLAEPFKDLDETVEKELVNLAIGIANQLVRREIKSDPGQIVAVISEAIAALPIAVQNISLLIHPEDVELVKNALALEDMSSSWNIIEDPLITRGGCKVKTETSLVDNTVENRLAMIVATILGGEREEDESQ